MRHKKRHDYESVQVVQVHITDRRRRLADPQQDQVPCESQKFQLQAAGLGRKKVVFGNKKGSRS